MNCKFNSNSLIGFTDWHLTLTAGMYTTHYNFYKFSSVTTDRVCANNRSQHGENSRLDCSSLDYFILWSYSSLFTEGFWKSFLNANVKSLMIKCINDGFHSDCQCSHPHCALGWAAGLWPVCFVWTTCSHSLKTNCPALTTAIDTYQMISWIQF